MSYVLAAEDDPHIQLLIQRKLEGAGYKVIIFGNGEEALAYALNDPPGVLILDVMLPGMTGLEVCYTVKEQLGARAPRVIIVSARGQTQDVEAAEAAGSDAYLIKPFSPGDLLQHVAQYMRP